MAGVNLLVFYLSLLSKHVMELNSGEEGIDNKKIFKAEKKIDMGENSSFFIPLKSLRNISETSEFDTTEHYEDDPSGGDSFTDTPSSIDNGN